LFVKHFSCPPAPILLEKLLTGGKARGMGQLDTAGNGRLIGGRLVAAADCELGNSGTESDMVTMRAVMMTAKWRNFASRHFSGAVINFLDGHANYFKDSSAIPNEI
jgi:hypothetical protein